jgi:hypothetical protein
VSHSRSHTVSGSVRQKAKKSAARTARILFAEHRERPLRYWGTLHVAQDYDLSVLRRGLSQACRRDRIPPTWSKIEQSRRGSRPHLHFLWHDALDKPLFRQVLAEVLGAQGVTSRRIRFQVQRIKNPVAVIRYCSKASSNFYHGRRKTFTVGAFLHRPASELARRTPREIWRSKIGYIAADPYTLHRILDGTVRLEDVRRPRWLSFWRRVGRRNCLGL